MPQTIGYILAAVMMFFSTSIAFAESVQEDVSGTSHEVTFGNPGQNDKAVQNIGNKVLGVSETGLYIVRLQDAPLARYSGNIPGLRATSPRVTGAPLDVSAPESIAYREHLEGVQDRFIRSMPDLLNRSVDVRFQYLNVLNAVAVDLEHHEVIRLVSLPEVVAIYPDTVRDLDTDVGPELIGARAFWDGDAGLNKYQGEGVVVGVLDTGINPGHPSFAAEDDDGYKHLNPRGEGNYVGVCNPEEAGQEYDPFCNDKLIGAWSFIDGPNSANSARDWHSHGSHVAGTIAGNRHTANVPVGSDPFNRPLSGVAPRANIISYQVCDPRCPTTSSLAAINQAVQDGVEVLNYSISGSDKPWDDPVDLAFLDAYAAGVFVAASAGNDGPEARTVAKTGPWNASVAASTHNRIIANSVDVMGSEELQGMPAVPGEGAVLEADIEQQILWAGDVDPDNVLGCAPFPDNAFNRAVALIQRGDCVYADKIENAHDAGAVAVIVYNNTGGPPITMGGLQEAAIPAVFLDINDGTRLRDYIVDQGNVSVRINEPTMLIFNDTWENLIAGFSSRGPSQWDLLKPDFAAPGVNILAAGHDGAEDYVFMQGTSMASPHAAGAAALLRQRHPNWTPAEIKSALALTAWQDMRNFDGKSPAGFYDMGSGRIDLAQAYQVGLVMDESAAKYQAADPAQGGSPKSLNQPSLVDLNCTKKCSWTRSFRSVLDEPATYNVQVSALDGMSVTVEPEIFSIAQGASQEIQISVQIDDALFRSSFGFGQISLDANKEHVAEHRLPIIVSPPQQGHLPGVLMLLLDDE